MANDKCKQLYLWLVGVDVFDDIVAPSSHVSPRLEVTNDN